jgi:hypothetical protein
MNWGFSTTLVAAAFVYATAAGTLRLSSRPSVSLRAMR